MGATNTTANYNLSQFISTDKPAWLQDYNGDMLKIDTGINAAKLAADTAQSTATNAQTDATSAVNSVTTLATTVSSLSTAIGNINGTLNTITSLIGNGTPTTTDHTIIGAINELHADQGDLDDLQTTDKSSLVAAINEAAQSGGGSSHTYSTTEHVIGTFNNKDVYEKTFVVTTISSPMVIDATMPSSYFDEVLSMEITAQASDGNWNSYQEMGNNQVHPFTHSDGLKLIVAGVTLSKVIITMRYTKA